MNSALALYILGDVILDVEWSDNGCSLLLSETGSRRIWYEVTKNDSWGKVKVILGFPVR